MEEDLMHTSHNLRGSTDDGREPHAKALRWEGADWPRSPEERRGWEMSRPLTGTQHGKKHSKSLTSLRPTAFEALHSPEAGAESTEHGLAARGLAGWKLHPVNGKPLLWASEAGNRLGASRLRPRPVRTPVQTREVIGREHAAESVVITRQPVLKAPPEPLCIPSS